MAEDKKPGTAVMTWKEKANAVMAQSAAMSAPKGGFLSFKNGRLSYDDTPIPGDKLNCIILDFSLLNEIYKEKYNALKKATPMCYAIGRDESEMAPHPDCAEPQNDICGIAGEPGCCPMNEWASNPEGGRGKGCKNGRRVAVIAADCLKAEDPIAAIKKATIAMCNLPVTSVQYFSKTINQIVKVMGVPPFAVVVELSVTPSDNMFSVYWKVQEGIVGDDLMEALYARHESAAKLVMAPYPKLEDEAAAPASKKY